MWIDRDFEKKWFTFTVKNQMPNVGNEVLRSIKLKINELNLYSAESNDYFTGNNTYETSDEVLSHKPPLQVVV